MSAAASLSWLEAVALGTVEGVTEFLPVSSTAHLTMLERAFGMPIDDPGVTAFTAIVQIGAVLATLLVLRETFLRLMAAGLRGVASRRARRSADFRLAVAVAAGCIPIGIVGLVFKDTIETTLRSLWFVGFALVGWSAVMLAAEKAGSRQRDLDDVTIRDTLTIGVVQCLALIPGVSRSGATMSAGLFRGLDRVTVTHISFLLSVPVLAAAGTLQAVTEAPQIASGVGWGPTLLATAIAFGVALVTVRWLLTFIATHTYRPFVAYRIAVGIVLLTVLATGLVAPR